MKVDGACFCGHVTFEAEIDPDGVVLCHCTDCQRMTSSAFRMVAPARPGSFRLLSGEPTIFVKTAESGRRRRQAFCPVCGTSIYSAPADAQTQLFGLRAGTLRQYRSLVPKRQIWRRSEMAWLHDVADLPGRQTD